MEHPVLQHSELLVELNASTKSAHKRLDNIDKLTELFHDMNINISIIANETQNQGKQLVSIVENMKKQGDKIDLIEEQMETKETVSKLKDRVETIEKKDGVRAEQLLSQIKWLLIGLSITAVFGLVWAKFGG